MEKTKDIRPWISIPRSDKISVGRIKPTFSVSWGLMFLCFTFEMVSKLKSYRIHMIESEISIKYSIDIFIYIKLSKIHILLDTKYKYWMHMDNIFIIVELNI